MKNKAFFCPKCEEAAVVYLSGKGDYFIECGCYPEAIKKQVSELALILGISSEEVKKSAKNLFITDVCV